MQLDPLPIAMLTSLQFVKDQAMQAWGGKG